LQTEISEYSSTMRSINSISCGTTQTKDRNTQASLPTLRTRKFETLRPLQLKDAWRLCGAVLLSLRVDRNSDSDLNVFRALTLGRKGRETSSTCELSLSRVPRGGAVEDLRPAAIFRYTGNCMVKSGRILLYCF
jgi:hypothetical protein